MTTRQEVEELKERLAKVEKRVAQLEGKRRDAFVGVGSIGTVSPDTQRRIRI